MLQLKEFLPPAAHDEILAWALENEKAFEPTLIGKGAEDTSFRVSQRLDELGPCRDLLRGAVKPRLSEFAEACGIDHVTFRGFDAELVAHNDGAFYRPHIDIGPPDSPFHRRLISAVYYFHRVPKAYSGGELRLFSLQEAGAFTDSTPEDNMLLVFPALVPHEVRPVHCPSRAFRDSRFAINLWAHAEPSGA
jgi:SM-20-related protein